MEALPEESAMADAWIGNGYASSPQRILVLGESWWGDLAELTEYIPKWAARRIADHTFSRIFNAGSGLHTSKATGQQRLAFWHTIAFCNFVTGTVGDARSDRPTPAQYKSAALSLPSVLRALAPQRVWVLGLGQAEYSLPVVNLLRIAHETVPHPTSYGLKAEVLRSSWLALCERKVENTDRVRG
jgi:hypothetical protein